MSQVSIQLSNVKKAIEAAALKVGRDPLHITLVAVSKGQPFTSLQEVLTQGHADLGENYAQEFLEKASALENIPVFWHFIGHLQRRKVKDVIGKIGLLHSLDSLALGLEIEKRASAIHKNVPCLIEVNLAHELTKSGIRAEALPMLLKDLKNLKHVEVVGLMTLPPPSPDPQKSRPYFNELKILLDEINRLQIYPTQLKELSMGMSHDYTVAIEEGATIVRVGTALFGARE
jgi:pyridoxal phosphate enzyme (YggS family)